MSDDYGIGWCLDGYLCTDDSCVKYGHPGVREAADKIRQLWDDCPERTPILFRGQTGYEAKCGLNQGHDGSHVSPYCAWHSCGNCDVQDPCTCD